MRSFATEDNPDVVLAKQQLSALQSQLEHLAGSQHDTGSDIVLSKGRVTGAGMEYLRRYRDLKYNETVYELLTKELEIAKLDEAREGEIVQVVDTAIPPDKKSSPHRTLIVIGMTVLAFFVAVFWVIVREGLGVALVSQRIGDVQNQSVITGRGSRNQHSHHLQKQLSIGLIPALRFVVQRQSCV